MDTRTGQIHSAEELEKMFGDIPTLPSHMMPIEPDEMTPKQEETRQVSKYDSKSKLGKKFTAARHQRNYFFNRADTGSGYKQY
jgi:hypothetical protein